MITALWIGLSGLLNAGAVTQPKTDQTQDDHPVSTALVPLVNFTTDRGMGYGAYGAVFTQQDGEPLDVPYRLQVGAQWYRTTGGYQDHKLVVDVPALADGRIRAGVQLGWERWDDALYFGIGNRLPRLRPSDTPRRRYAFGIDSIRGLSTLRWRYAGAWSLFGGHLFRSASVKVYSGSRLEDDRPSGVEGGLLSQVFVGVMMDSRDDEGAPRSGVWSELSVRQASPTVGSTWTMWGLNATDRRYFTLASPRFVLATRGALDVQGKETPFFHQIVMGGSQWVDIGGPLAMRGLPIGRYRGQWTVYADAEIRWEAAQFSLGRSRYRVFMVPFASGAQIVDPKEEGARFHPHGGVGVGGRLLFNDVVQARLEFAVGREEYRTDNEDARIQAGWVPAVYLAFNTPY